MGTTFSMFDTTPAGAVAAIKAAILASTDWSNPASDRVTCTTTRGAAMVVDLADAAALATGLQFGVYRTTGLADKITRYLRWRSSGGATSDPLHVVVSAGKEHLYVSVEGPRVGEPNDNSGNGNHRPIFWLCDLVPYLAADTIPVVVCGGTTTSSIPSNPAENIPVHVSRNAANNASWVPGLLETLAPSQSGSTTITRFTGQSQQGSNVVVRPWVLLEDVAGMRGRLAALHYLGRNGSAAVGDTPATTFQRVTIGSATYIGLAPAAKVQTAVSLNAFGNITWNDAGYPLVAVPYS